MGIHSYRGLIDWTRDLHSNLARCMEESARKHEDERSQGLLEYFAKHESALATKVEEFKQKAGDNALATRAYDYLSRYPIDKLQVRQDAYAKLDFNDICREVFAFHDEVIDLFEALTRRADIPEARSLLGALLEMEENEARRLARQTEQMRDM